MPTLQAVGDLSGPVAAISSGLVKRQKSPTSSPRPECDCDRSSEARDGECGRRPARRAAMLTALSVALLAMLARSQPSRALDIARALDPREPPGLRLVARLLMDCVGLYTSSPSS